MDDMRPPETPPPTGAWPGGSTQGQPPAGWASQPGTQGQPSAGWGAPPAGQGPVAPYGPQGAPYGQPGGSWQPPQAWTPPPPATWPEPMPVTVAPPSSKKGGGIVNAFLSLAIVVAVGGIAFAAGRITAPAAAISGAPSGFGNGTTTNGGGVLVPRASGAPLSVTGTGTGPGGFRGGLGGGAVTLSGTVSAIAADSITLTTATGTSVTIPTSATTTYHHQAAGAVGDVAVGSSVQVLVAGFARGTGTGGGGFRPDASLAPGATPAPRASRAPGGFAGGGTPQLGPAEDVTVVGP